ncbi:hypothetical protein J4419_04620 [Candidatus Woesearchaeota archaeon]|nr:hypothetical protein [Candidatus Woesearchaeota archaeon]
MREQSIFLRFVGDSPMARVLDYLLSIEGLDFCISDLADNAHVGRATLYRIWDSLIEHEVLVPTRTIGKAKLFKLNDSNPKIKKLIELDRLLTLESPRKRAKEQELLETEADKF